MSFEGHELYPDFVAKAAVLAVRVSSKHPLPDGNKRLAWACLTMICTLNGHDLRATPDDAVAVMWAVAAGDVDEGGLASWLEARL